MKSLCCLLFAAAVLVAPALATEQSWVGTISDSDCGATHKSGTEHPAGMTDADCVKACVKAGARYVLVSDGKVLNISNQTFAGLLEHAGHTVKMTGAMTGDGIEVTQIEMPKKT